MSDVKLSGKSAQPLLLTPSRGLGFTSWIQA